jgi:acetyl-CoA carboxylase carboxyl transferase subunit alpha
VAYTNVKQFILEQTQILKKISIETLIEQRYLKFRSMGQTSTG